MYRKRKLFLFILMLTLFVGTYCVMTFTSIGDQGIMEYNDYGLLDTKVDGYTITEARQSIEELGEKGTKLAKQYYVIDFAFLTSNCIVQLMMTGWAASKLLTGKKFGKRKLRQIAKLMIMFSYILTILKFLMDFGENALIELMLNIPSFRQDQIFRLASDFTKLKMKSFILWLPIAGIILIFLILTKWLKKTIHKTIQ